MRRIFFLIALLCLIQACESAPTLSPSIRPTPDPSIHAAVMPYTPSPEEAALIDKLVARHPGPAGDAIRASLNDPKVLEIELPNNAEDQALLNQIYSMRRATRTENRIKAAHDAKVADANIFTITVALVPSLGDNANVSARVIRRRNPSPRELILLPEGGEDVGAFAAALTVLVRNRASQGDIIGQDVRMDIEGAGIPKSWDAATQSDARRDLETLKAAKVRTIPGVGRVRATEILARDT